MNKLDIQKNQSDQDWLPAYIIYQLALKGMTVRRLSLQRGYSSSALNMALRQPWLKAEKIIADFLGVPPETIWPSRYNWNGTGKRRPRGGYRPSRNFSTGSQRAVIQRKRAA